MGHDMIKHSEVAFQAGRVTFNDLHTRDVSSEDNIWNTMPARDEMVGWSSPREKVWDERVLGRREYFALLVGSVYDPARCWLPLCLEITDVTAMGSGMAHDSKRRGALLRIDTRSRTNRASDENTTVVAGIRWFGAAGTGVTA